jgi:hypothetical protein
MRKNLKKLLIQLMKELRLFATSVKILIYSILSVTFEEKIVVSQFCYFSIKFGRSAYYCLNSNTLDIFDQNIYF